MPPITEWVFRNQDGSVVVAVPDGPTHYRSHEGALVGQQTISLFINQDHLGRERVLFSKAEVEVTEKRAGVRWERHGRIQFHLLDGAGVRGAALGGAALRALMDAFLLRVQPRDYFRAKGAIE